MSKAFPTPRADGHRTRTFSNRSRDNDESQGYNARSEPDNEATSVSRMIANVVALIHKIIKKWRLYSNIMSCQSFRRGRVGLLRGFLNFGATDDPGESRRQSAAVGRLLKRLHVRGLIVKVPRIRRGSSVKRDIVCSRQSFSSTTTESRQLLVELHNTPEIRAHRAGKSQGQSLMVAPMGQVLGSTFKC